MQLASAEVAGPVTQYLGGGRIDEHDPPVGVGADDALGRGAQDHLGLPLRPGQLGLGVHGPGQVAHDEHQQLVAAVAVTVVGLLAVLQVRAGDLDGELGPVGPAGDHPGRLGPPARIHVVGPPHGAGDELGVELRQQIEQPAPHQSGARSLEGLQRDGVGVDDGPIGVDQDQRVGQRVEYGCEASSASGWPAAHETLPPCYRTLPTARAILPTCPRRVTRGSLRAAVALATPDEREVARRSDVERVSASRDRHPCSARPSGVRASAMNRRCPPTLHHVPCPTSSSTPSSTPAVSPSADLGQQRHEPVPARDLAAVAAVEPRVDGPPGPGPGDMRGGGTAVLHGADAALGHGGEGVAAPTGCSDRARHRRRRRRGGCRPRGGSRPRTSRPHRRRRSGR